jgi:hypothetical protein
MKNEPINPESIMNHADGNLELLENSFPVSAFPKAIQEIILAANQYLKFPIDFIGASILFAASIAVGSTNKVKVMNSWVEITTMYIALVGRPGSNKTHPLRFAINPILKQDKESYLKFKAEKAEYEKAVKDETMEELNIPICEKRIVSDFTPEALVEVHSNNLRGLGVYSDELNQWLKNFNRYNNGSAMEFWLSNFSGTQINIDRKNQDTLMIPYTSIGVCGGIQPGLLQELKKDSKGQNGFNDRILWAFPDDLKKEYWSEIELPQRFIDAWERIIRNLLDLPLRYSDEGEAMPRILELSILAKDELRKWQAKNADLINDTESDSLAGIYSKLETYIIRFALILELMQMAADKPECQHFNNTDNIEGLYQKALNLLQSNKNSIQDQMVEQLHHARRNENINEVQEIYYYLNKPRISLSSIEASIKLIEYFRKTARRVNSIIQNAPMEGLDVRHRALYQLLPDAFKTNEAVTVAYNSSFPERSLKRFLNDKTYFEKIEHGKYKKRF